MTDHAVPPRELVEQWASEKCYDERDWLYELHIAARAAQWGADQELDACCDWLRLHDWVENDLRDELRAARRPKPPSLKEQALEDLDSLIADLANHGMGFNATNIRRALEQLDD